MLTSSTNPKIKLIRKLQNRKEREQSGIFYFEGLRGVTEAVLMDAQIEYIVTAPELLNSQFGMEMLQKAQMKGVTIVEVSADTFKNFSLKDGPQGVGAVIHQQWTKLDDVYTQPGTHWVVLDSIADPGNLGTILRTNDATGGSGIILLDQSTDPFDPISARASTGALFTQRLIKTGSEEFIQWKRTSGLAAIGTSGAAQQNYQHITYPDPCLILMGSERHGLQDNLFQICDNIVSIPMVGRSDSLNLAVATGIILYELFNQHRQAGHSYGGISL